MVAEEILPFCHLGKADDANLNGSSWSFFESTGLSCNIVCPCHMWYLDTTLSSFSPLRLLEEPLHILICVNCPILQEVGKLVTRLQEQVLRSLQTSLGEGQISESEKFVV